MKNKRTKMMIMMQTMTNSKKTNPKSPYSNSKQNVSEMKAKKINQTKKVNK